MSVSENQNLFPRDLSEKEKEWIFLMLPSGRPGYQVYRDKISALMIIGFGRFGEGNYILGHKGDELDFTSPAAPVLATGTVICDRTEIDISIHEEFENQIEIDLDTRGSNEIPDECDGRKYWTYSDWQPGRKAPGDNSYVREVHLIKDELVIAVASEHKRVWIYEKVTGINHLIPMTNFYNEIMLLKNERDPKVALDPNRLFTHLDELSDDEIRGGFLRYNKYLKKLSIDYTLFKKDEKKKKKSLFNFLNRSKN